METVLKADRLTKQYGRKPALSQLVMRIDKGDIYGFVGNNGAGKTTFMKIVMGLTRETSGSYELFGISNDRVTAGERRRVSAIIEMPAFYPHMTGLQNLKAHLLSMGEKASKDKIYSVLDRVKLREEANKKVKQYSLGMKQRLGIARALLTNAELMILDEPTNGLDPSGIVELRKLILELNQEHGITFLISSHHIMELSHFINKLGIIRKGRMVEETRYEDLKKKLEQTGDNLEDYIMKRTG